MSKELNYIADLERENRLLGERCTQLLKDKGDLTDKIADIKANCDLAIEGRDIKIMELEKENAELKEQIRKKEYQEENYLNKIDHKEEVIKTLQEMIEKMKLGIKEIEK